MLRRILTLLPGYDSTIRQIFHAYQNIQYNGTPAHETPLPLREPIPPHGHQQRQLWKHSQKPRGPIGLLLQSLHEAGAQLHLDQGIIQQFGTNDIQLLTMPWQQLPAAISRVVSTALFRAEAPNRTALRSITGVD
eukprot:9470339-Karenia_brevis.AAC.1